MMARASAVCGQPVAAAVRYAYMTILAAAVRYAYMTIPAAAFVFPFFWKTMSSFKSAADICIYPPIWIPSVFHWDNYPEVFRLVPYTQWFANTLPVVTLSTIGVVLSSAVVAYSFARFHYPGRTVLFLLTLGTMMLPAEVMLIPSYLLFKYLGWLNTLMPLWAPAWLGGGAFYILLLRQFILGIPATWTRPPSWTGRPISRSCSGSYSRS